MRLALQIAVVAVIASALATPAANAVGPWEQPAANLADQVAEIMGPGQARLTIQNLSTIPTDQIPTIRRLLVEDLKTHGVAASGAESANAIRVTLSENVRERLWVAEVVEGNQTRVTMVRVDRGTAQQTQQTGGLTLRKQTVLITGDAVLAVLETQDSLVAVEQEEIVVYSRVAGAWQARKRIAIGQKKPLPRDPRAVIVPSPDGDGFSASLAGTSCSGSYRPAQPEGEWTVHCAESDDPWTIGGPSSGPASPAADPAIAAVPLKAFYNAARNYFTGMVVPDAGVELASFYSATMLPRSDGAGWLIGGIDGKIQIAENGALKPVAGARDWGSDFAAIHTGCGAGTQIIVSGSGAAATDSLRAFELPAQEAIPASAPLAMAGSVTALWTAPDGRSVFAVVGGADDRYEVDRVTALCN